MKIVRVKKNFKVDTELDQDVYDNKVLKLLNGAWKAVDLAAKEVGKLESFSKQKMGVDIADEFFDYVEDIKLDANYILHILEEMEKSLKKNK